MSSEIKYQLVLEGVFPQAILRKLDANDVNMQPYGFALRSEERYTMSEAISKRDELIEYDSRMNCLRVEYAKN